MVLYNYMGFDNNGRLCAFQHAEIKTPILLELLDLADLGTWYEIGEDILIINFHNIHNIFYSWKGCGSTQVRTKFLINGGIPLRYYVVCLW